MNITFLIYIIIGTIGVGLYFYSALRNKSANIISDNLFQESINKNDLKAGKTRIFKSTINQSNLDSDTIFGNKLDTINSKKIKRFCYVFFFVITIYAIFSSTILNNKTLNNENNINDFLPYFAILVFSISALYQIFLTTKIVYLYQKGVVYKSIFSEKRIAYNYLNIIETFDTERRKPIANWLFEFNSFNYDLKIPVYYFNGDKGTSIKISQQEFSFTKSKIFNLQENLVWV